MPLQLIERPSRLRLLVLTYYRFPCAEPVIETVFAKHLAEQFPIALCFQSDRVRKEALRWHHSEVYLIGQLQFSAILSNIVTSRSLDCGLLKIIALIQKRRPAYVLVRDMPCLALALSLLSRIFDFRLYFQYTAPIGDISLAYARSVSGLQSIKHLFLGTSFNLFIIPALKASDMVFPISDSHMAQLSPYIDPNKLKPITMGVDDVQVCKPRRDVPQLEELVTKNYLIGYFGTLSFVRRPHFLLDLFRSVVKHLPNCKLLLMGTTAYPFEMEELIRYATRTEIRKHLIFTGRLDRDTLYDHLRYCFLTLSAIPPEPHYQISSPTKLYESLGVGIPVIANREIYEHRKVIKQSRGGILVDYQVDSFANAALWLLKNPSARNEMSTKGKQYVTNHYGYGRIAAGLAEVFCG